MTAGGASATAVAELAALYGVQTSFEGADGLVHRADEDVIVAILRALGALGAPGAPVTSAAQAAEALSSRRRSLALRRLEPVLVHRIGRSGTATVTVTLPGRVPPRSARFTIELEDGETRHHTLVEALTAMTAGPEIDGAVDGRYRFRLQPGGAPPLPPGYHRLTVEWPGAEATALLVSAPACPAARRGWGVFLPLHALRTDDDWGVGSYRDLAELGKWVGEVGGSMLGALPLYPAFLEPPADPSPYLPVSRLAYNEIFIDPTALPELAAAPEAQRLLASDGFRRRIAAAHGSLLVDYEEVSRLRREVLTPMADALLTGGSARRSSFCAFFEEHPELMAYARFRAAGDRLGRRSAEELRAHGAVQGEEATLGYHLYTQWVAAEQLTAAAVATPLYADLPVGVHPDGFDPSWAPESFVPGVHGGAPPDLFFGGGQDWAFPPLHPERMREDGYRYFIAMLRRAFRHASYLRFDHVMGLDRLYFVPEGFDARHGAYVSYRADELHALVALEAHRAGTVVVGEDLGTVPDSLRARMAEDRMLRSWVLQFESAPQEPLPVPPEEVLASWGTHDLPRFGTYFWGDDLDEMESDGQLSATDAAAERADRTRWRRAMVAATGAEAEAGAVRDEDTVNDNTAADTAADADNTDLAATVLRGCLAHLARSPADLVLVDLEELWGERQPQNRPGTGTGAANWRRRASRTLGEMNQDTDTIDFLRQLDQLRQPAESAPAKMEVTP